MKIEDQVKITEELGKTLALGLDINRNPIQMSYIASEARALGIEYVRSYQAHQRAAEIDLRCEGMSY